MIDLRSDTVTCSTEEMRRAMLDAAVGDDVFGEDPTVNRLEEHVAVLLGKGAALYCPSGTMTNQIGVHVGTDRSDEVILHEDAHIFNYEAGAPALLSGVQLRPVSGKGGVVSLKNLRAAIRPNNVHFPRPKLLCLENRYCLKLLYLVHRDLAETEIFVEFAGTNIDRSHLKGNTIGSFFLSPLLALFEEGAADTQTSMFGGNVDVFNGSPGFGLEGRRSFT